MSGAQGDGSAVSPFHAGERSVQRRLGVRDASETAARRLIRPFLTGQQRAFFMALPFIVVAGRDRACRPWVTMLTGPPGFVQSPEPRCLRLNAAVAAGEPVAERLAPGEPVGLLGIDLATRRRNRVNGRIIATDAAGLTVRVDQAFGNCARYITRRVWRRSARTMAGVSAVRRRRLEPAMSRWIGEADTLFIASGYGAADGSGVFHGMDVSHRGGPAGFVRVSGATRLELPDYAGNNFFNTLGNLVTDPRVGLLFVNFATGGMLQITGRASIDWGCAPPGGRSGAERRLEIDIDAIVQRDGVLPLRWERPGSTGTLEMRHYAVPDDLE